MRYFPTVFLLFLAPCHADWTDEDSAYEAAYLILHAADWTQTRYIASRPDRFSETNGVLGEHPNDSKVNRYFIVTGLIHAGVSYVLPDKLRRSFQLITIGMESVSVSKNIQIGIKMKF